jgi:hypothetical protein
VKYPIGTIIEDIEVPGDIGIVCAPARSVGGDAAVWAHWKSFGYGRPRWLYADKTRLHPDPDAAWADYCAAVLRGDVS